MMSPVMPLGTVSAAAMVCGPATVVVMASAGSTVRAAVSAVV